MTDFRIEFEWEEAPRVRAPELDATWARLEIHAGADVITKVEAHRTESLRKGIYVPLFPVAEWIVANWWLLLEQWRTDTQEPRHNLLYAREGFALPDLAFSPTETKIELRWRPVAAPQAGVSFLSGGSAIVEKTAVREQLRRVVDAVLNQLDRRFAAETGAGKFLREEWQAIQESESDPEQKAFCENAARLGCDPFDIDPAVAAQIEGLGGLLPEPLLEDYCDAISLPQIASGAATVKAFLDSAGRGVPSEGKWRSAREAVGVSQSATPWMDGYHQALALRAFLGLNGKAPTEPDLLLRDAFGSFEVRDFAAPGRIQAITAPGEDCVPVFGVPAQVREEQRRFSLCRALSDYLASGLPSLVTRSQTEHQQRNRAFAAQFLAPAESIRKRIMGWSPDEDGVYELAREFRVSELVIRHQIRNHGLAELVGE
jgi:hypothetical protein